MNDKKRYSPNTIAAQAAGYLDDATGGVVPPLQPSTTYTRDNTYQLVRPDNIYGRDNSDIVRLAEVILAQLEKAEDALLFPSGMAAIAALFRTLGNGATILMQSGIYWGTTKWVHDFAKRRGMNLHVVDAHKPKILAQACKTFTPDLIFVETPSNPWLRTVDVAAAAEAAKSVKAILAVDATAATPILMQPLALGADIVVHSATKAIGGHSDVLGGMLATNDKHGAIWEAIGQDRHDAGAIIGTFEAWLLVRSIRTLPLRVKAMSENALAVAQYLQSHSKVAEVLYPGLATHSGHDVATRQMNGCYGSLLSFLVKGDQKRALEVAGKLQLFHRATSLGGVESLVEHRYSIEPHTGIPETLLRLSVGIEDVNDLISDLEAALA